MHWITATIIAAVFLGIFDLCNKHAVRGNAVFPVLFLSTCVSAAVWGALLVMQRAGLAALPAALTVAPLTPFQHLQVLAKSGIVTASWVCTYFAVKHLPVSIAGPIRATQPLWILGGALLVFAERPSALQGMGIAVTLGSFVVLSLAGREEGVHFLRNKWVGYMIAGTLLGGVSSLYDKYLFGRAGFSVPAVQAWFSLYLAMLIFPLFLGWWRRWWPRNEFHWRWSIPAIAVSLLVSDYLYFGALRDPEALVSLVASIRRASVLVSFAGGLLLFQETGGWRKLPAVLGILAGICLIAMG
jgi:bacterial/archaeal transporter family protein